MKNTVLILDDISSIDFFGNCEINETFAKQWSKIIDSAVDQKEIINFETQMFGLNIVAKVGLDTYVLPLNEAMREFDINYLLNEFKTIVTDLYNLKAKCEKIVVNETGKVMNALPF